MKIKRQSAEAILRNISDTEIRIDYIEAKEKRQGHGTDLMLYICSMADQLGLDVSLLPVVNSGMPLKKLKAWYASFGFVDYPSGMIRVCKEIK